MRSAANDPLSELLRAAEAHHDAGRLPQAEQWYRQILAANPDHADALHYLGMLAYQVGRFDVAEELIRRAIAVEPNLADSHNNLGETLRALGRSSDAITSYQRAIALSPTNAQIHDNLGNALHDVRRVDEAIESYRRATTLRPDFAETHHNLGHALTTAGRVDEAIASYRRALALDPSLVQCHSQLLVQLNCQPDVDAASIAKEAERWRLHHAEAFEVIARPPHPNDRSSDRRLRIGYVSADFFEHTCAHFIEPLLRCHDRAKFEIVCYAHVSRPDALTARFQSLSDAWRFVAPLSDEQLAEQVRQDAIDILVDLKLHTQNHRLLAFARKPAPVQVTWLGYPGTTGLRSIDYRLTDPHLDPPGCDESVYSEQTVRLPDTFWCYDPLATEPAVSALPACTAGQFTFGCLNHFGKVNDRVLKLWARVMNSIENSRLLLLAPEGESRRRVLAILSGEGIEPGHVEFVSHAPRPQYLRTYHRIDLALDTLPYNGHTTSLDALWMGVPVITLVGSTVVGRAGAGQLANLGLPDLIARTPDEFVAIAAELARDLPRLAELRRTLRPRMQASPLMDAPRFARNVEAAYRQMWKTWCGRD